MDFIAPAFGFGWKMGDATKLAFAVFLISCSSGGCGWTRVCLCACASARSHAGLFLSVRAFGVFFCKCVMDSCRQMCIELCADIAARVCMWERMQVLEMRYCLFKGSLKDLPECILVQIWHFGCIWWRRRGSCRIKRGFVEFIVHLGIIWPFSEINSLQICPLRYVLF